MVEGFLYRSQLQPAAWLNGDGSIRAKDPLRFGGGLTDLYSHVGSDPINKADPEGRWVFVFGGMIKDQFPLREGLRLRGL